MPDSSPVASPATETPPSPSLEPPAPAGADDVVAVEGISRAFDGRVVVRDLDLTVRRGTILGIIGPSGSGKTTTIRMLTGALKPSSGTISVLGERPDRFRRSTQERIGYMPQSFTLYRDLSARENLDFVASMFGLLWPRRRKRIREVLTLLDLYDARNRRAGQLSGGMQRRLELACALVHEPVLLFLDEPTAGIDPLLRVTVWNELHRLRDAGITLLVTTQYVNEAEECDQVALIARGRLVAHAAPDELRRQAVGGDQLWVRTAGLIDGRTIEPLADVHGVKQMNSQELLITVGEAATALPTIVDAITASGIEVESAREVPVSFDDVFAALLERAGADDEAEQPNDQATEPVA
jgi:ABC-2 type transport system ATP-binding protein